MCHENAAKPKPKKKKQKQKLPNHSIYFLTVLEVPQSRLPEGTGTVRGQTAGPIFGRDSGIGPEYLPMRQDFWG